METRYILDKAFYNSHDSEYFKEEINTEGYCLPIGPNYRVYAGPLAALLIADEVPVMIDTRKSDVTWEIEESEGVVLHKPTVVESGESIPGTISGSDYAALYKAAYDDGREWFIRNYSLTPAILYGSHAKSYVDNLHNLLCHTPCGTGRDGVIGWRGIMTRFINKQNIAEIAYHSGILSEIEILEEKHPHLISDLVECRHSLENIATTTSAPPASDERKNAFNSMPLDEVRQWFIQLAETNSKNGNPFLTPEQVGQFIDRAFCGKSFAEKMSINERNGDKANVIGLFHLFYIHCTNHQSGKGKIDPSATAKKYVELLTDYFDNWIFKQVNDNFRSGGNWKNKP